MDENLAVFSVLTGVFVIVPLALILVKSKIGEAFAQYIKSKSESNSNSIELLIKSNQNILGIEERLSDLEREIRSLKEITTSQQVLSKHNNEQKLLP